jgi:hypothetical protein
MSLHIFEKLFHHGGDGQSEDLEASLSAGSQSSEEEIARDGLAQVSKPTQEPGSPTDSESSPIPWQPHRHDEMERTRRFLQPRRK